MQLAKAAGAYVIATASPRSSDQVKAQGADEIIDYTTADLATAVTEPVDVVLNLAPIDPAVFTALAGSRARRGVVVSTTVWMPAPSDDERGVRGIDLYVNSDREQLSELVARIDKRRPQGRRRSTRPAQPTSGRSRGGSRRHPPRQDRHRS